MLCIALSTTQKKCSVVLLISAAVAIACLWFYVDLEVAAEAEALAEALELENEAPDPVPEAAVVTDEAAPAAQGDFFADAGNWITGAAHDVGDFATDAANEVANVATDAVETVSNPSSIFTNMFTDWIAPLINPILKYGAKGGACVSAVLSGWWAFKSGDSKVKRSGGITCGLMFLTMAAMYFCPTQFSGWLVKGMGITSVASALLTCYFLWKDSSALSTLPFAPMGVGIAAPGCVVGSAPVPTYVPPPAYSPPPPAHSPPAWTPATASGSAGGTGSVATSSTSPPGSGSGGIRRLIEQNFQFSDHSLLLRLFVILICLAVYCFIQEANSNDTKNSSAYITKKHPVHLVSTY